MTNDGKKTLAEHKEYIEKMARLSFFFARRLKDKNPETPLSDLLRDRTPLLYHGLNYPDYLTKWNNPDCQRILKKADELSNLPAPEFEERMFAEIKDLAMERAERFYPESVGIDNVPWGKDSPHSLKLDPPDPKGKRALNWCNFHIANAVAPRSIYDDPRYLPECFMEIMARGEKEYGFDTLCTGTWLDDVPRWLALFPQEWIDNLSPRRDTTGWTFGNWGQLVTARGTFNDKAGQYARENLTLRYKCRSSHCSFAAMRKHLEELLKTTHHGSHG